MILVYVRRRYTGDVAKNTEEALEVAREINAVPGYMAVVPHNFSRGLENTKTEDEWLALCLVMMNACHLVCDDGAASDSRGCRIEERHRRWSVRVIERNQIPRLKPNAFDAIDATWET